ncbi:MAG: CotS family spore coat protein [Firmicutes bacterium]|nr:CotS family spore coat protein [Bacillota bacterium]
MSRQRKLRRTGFGVMLEQYRLLQSVADAYDLGLLQAQQQGSVFKVSTSQGWKKFKRFQYSIRDLEFVHSVLEHLTEKGWKRNAPLHLTKDGTSHVETPQGLFYACGWIQGTEMNSKDPLQVQAAANILGEMHRLLQDFSCEADSQRQYPESWQERYRKRGDDFLRYQEQAEESRKNKFSRRFRRAVDDFLRMMGNALQLMDEAGYDKMRQDASINTVCHGSPTASNFIAARDGKIYLIDFDNARRDLRLYDVVRMIIRHGDWDLDKSLFILQSYQEANPLTQEEIALIPALCSLPNRGWRAARAFYDRGEEQLGRLEKAINEIARQDSFVQALVKIQPAELTYKPKEIFQTIPYPKVSESTGILVPTQPSVDEVQKQRREVSLSQDTPIAQGEFYWGDPDLEPMEHKEDAVKPNLVAIEQYLDSLTERLDGMTIRLDDLIQALKGAEELSGDELEPLGKGLEVAALVAEELSMPGSKGEMDVSEALEYSGYSKRQESEVRLTTAVDMDTTNKGVPVDASSAKEAGNPESKKVMGEYVPAMADVEWDEIVEPGTEIPVEYSSGYDLTEAESAEEFVTTASVSAYPTAGIDDGGCGCGKTKQIPTQAGHQDVYVETAVEDYDIEAPAVTEPGMEIVETKTEAISAGAKQSESTVGDHGAVIDKTEQARAESEGDGDLDSERFKTDTAAPTVSYIGVETDTPEPVREEADAGKKSKAESKTGTDELKPSVWAEDLQAVDGAQQEGTGVESLSKQPESAPAAGSQSGAVEWKDFPEPLRRRRVRE